MLEAANPEGAELLRGVLTVAGMTSLMILLHFGLAALQRYSEKSLNYQPKRSVFWKYIRFGLSPTTVLKALFWLVTATGGLISACILLDPNFLIKHGLEKSQGLLIILAFGVIVGEIHWLIKRESKLNLLE